MLTSDVVGLAAGSTLPSPHPIPTAVMATTAPKAVIPLRIDTMPHNVGPAVSEHHIAGDPARLGEAEVVARFLAPSALVVKDIIGLGSASQIDVSGPADFPNIRNGAPPASFDLQPAESVSFALQDLGDDLCAPAVHVSWRDLRGQPEREGLLTAKLRQMQDKEVRLGMVSDFGLRCSLPRRRAAEDHPEPGRRFS